MASMSEAPHTLGPYSMGELLQRSAIRDVHQAESAGRSRALLVLDAALSADQRVREEFRVRLPAAAGVLESHVIALLDWGELDGRLCVAVPTPVGPTLADESARGPLPPPRVRILLGQLADALEACHVRGVHHLDLRPEHVVVTGASARITDLGVSAAVLAADAWPEADARGVAPEVFDGVIGVRADVHTLACLVQDLITGTAAGAREVLVPGAVAALLTRAQGPAPVRPHSVQEFRHAFELASRGEADATLAPRTPGPLPPPRPAAAQVPVAPAVGRPGAAPVTATVRRRRSPLPAVLAVLAALGVIALAALVGLGIIPIGSEREVADPVPSSSAPSSPTTAPTPTREPSATTVDSFPDGAVECPTVHAPGERWTRSAVGNERTSCPFAEEVRAALVSAGEASGTDDLEVRSPVTDREYRMTCAEQQNWVRCTGGDDAVVYVS